MQTAIADTSALASAAASNLLDLLAEQFERVVLAPAVVDELMELDVIDDLMASAVAQVISVVSLTGEDEALAEELSEQIARASRDPEAAAHRGEAEAMAVMGRRDLEAALLLCDDVPAAKIAAARDLPVQSFASFVATVRGDAAGQAVRALPRQHEPDEQGDEPEGPVASRGAPPATPVIAAPPLRRDPPATVEVDDETMSLVNLLVERGLADDTTDLVRRAVRGLAAALLD